MSDDEGCTSGDRGFVGLEDRSLDADGFHVVSNRGRFAETSNPLQLKLMEEKRKAEARAAEEAKKARLAVKLAAFGGGVASKSAVEAPAGSERRKAVVPESHSVIDHKFKEMMSSGIVNNKTRGNALLSSRGRGRGGARARVVVVSHAAATGTKPTGSIGRKEDTWDGSEDDSDSSSAAGGRGQAAGTAMPSGAFAIHLASRSVCPSSGVSGTHASLAMATPTRPLSVAVSWQETRPRSPSLGCDSEAFVSVRPHIAIDEQGRSRAATLVASVHAKRQSARLLPTGEESEAICSSKVSTPYNVSSSSLRLKRTSKRYLGFEDTGASGIVSPCRLDSVASGPTSSSRPKCASAVGCSVPALGSSQLSLRGAFTQGADASACSIWVDSDGTGRGRVSSIFNHHAALPPSHMDDGSRLPMCDIPLEPNFTSYGDLRRMVAERSATLSLMPRAGMETLMAPAQFSQVFELADYQAFAKLPTWQQMALRKKAKLHHTTANKKH